jgi:hypothetical protein
MDGQASFGWTSFHDDSRVQIAALGVLNANAKPLIYGRAGLDIDGNDILQASSDTMASAVLDIDQSNYFTMKMVMKTDGDITGADNPERRLEETGPPKSMTCARMDMVMDDPMRIEGIELNMTMETFIMNNARDFPRNFRGVVVEEHTSDIALREYPTEEFDKATECDANMRVAISMTSLASPPTPTPQPTPEPTSQPTITGKPSVQPIRAPTLRPSLNTPPISWRTFTWAVSFDILDTSGDMSSLQMVESVTETLESSEFEESVMSAAPTISEVQVEDVEASPSR